MTRSEQAEAIVHALAVNARYVLNIKCPFCFNGRVENGRTEHGLGCIFRCAIEWVRNADAEGAK